MLTVIEREIMLEKEIERLQTQNRLLQAELAPFRDDYFKDLDNSQVAELAKKSIRITKENREMEELLNDIYEESRYKTVLSFNVYSKLAKYVKEHKLEEL